MDGVTESGSSDQSLPPEQLARQHWMSVLAKASAAELESAMPSIRDLVGALPGYRLIRRPEVGMAMVRARAGGTGRQFNFGEMTMTRCTLQTADGRVGCAYVAGRSMRHAELAALIDALLQDPSCQAQLQALVIDPLARAQALRRQRRVERSAPTRVEFFTVVRGEDRP
jgi:alpha-D-ribose 1-methylphosphonate 5-triphosphate synthase subunit PhnG